MKNKPFIELVSSLEGAGLRKGWFKTSQTHDKTPLSTVCSKQEVRIEDSSIKPGDRNEYLCVYRDHVFFGFDQCFRGDSSRYS